MYADLKDRKFPQELPSEIDNYQESYITILDNEYPESLKQVRKPPFVLFFKGDIALLKQPSIVVSGTKNPTEEGLQFANELLEDSMNDQVVITSLTKGINEVVIEKCSNLICVLSGGLESKEWNKKLYEKVLEKGGLLISEFPFDTPSTHESCCEIARIQSGLAQKSLLLESNDQGAQIVLALTTLDQGKDVLVAPVSPLNKKSVNNKLIRDGAFSICDRKDLLSHLE